MIEIEHLTKHFGRVVAVEDLSFSVLPGVVTGFLGPNGAGKSTTMRLILGLDTADSGRALVFGQDYRELRYPLSEVGAVLDAAALHPGRSARDHLAWIARSNGIARSRVEEVLGLVGLSTVAARRAGTFSLGMRQRLGIAGALLGDPGVLLFDEPVNGLDPEGILWVRTLLRSLAAEGRTVFVSSHLMSEMALTADRLVVIGRGQLIADATVEEFVRGATSSGSRVVTPDATRFAALLAEHGAVVEVDGTALVVHEMEPAAVGDLAHEAGVRLHELSPIRASLEEAYMDLAADSVEYAAAPPAAVGTGSQP